MENTVIKDEHHLMNLLSKGDQHAYSIFFKQYWTQVYNIGLHFTKSPEQSKDLAQDVFIKIWNTRDRLAEVRNFSSYLYTITRNELHDKLRKQVFVDSNREALMNYFNIPEASPHELIVKKEERSILLHAVNELPPQLREVFKLSRFEGLSHAEIAKQLNITPTSSRIYMARALVAIRKNLNPGAALILIPGIILYFFLS